MIERQASAVSRRAMTIAEDTALPCTLEGTSVAQRVLIYGINYAPEPTGVGRYTGEIGAYLVRQGLEVEVVTAVPHYPGWVVRGAYRNRYSTERIARHAYYALPVVVESRDARRLACACTPYLRTDVGAGCNLAYSDNAPRYGAMCRADLVLAPAALLAAKIVGARTVLHVQDLEIDAAFAVGHLRGGLLSRNSQTWLNALSCAPSTRL